MGRLGVRLYYFCASYKKWPKQCATRFLYLLYVRMVLHLLAVQWAEARKKSGEVAEVTELSDTEVWVHFNNLTILLYFIFNRTQYRRCHNHISMKGKGCVKKKKPDIHDWTSEKLNMLQYIWPCSSKNCAVLKERFVLKLRLNCLIVDQSFDLKAVRLKNTNKL